MMGSSSKKRFGGYGGYYCNYDGSVRMGGLHADEN